MLDRYLGDGIRAYLGAPVAVKGKSEPLQTVVARRVGEGTRT
jgi:hypothetical protein